MEGKQFFPQILSQGQTLGTEVFTGLGNVDEWAEGLLCTQPDLVPSLTWPETWCGGTYTHSLSIQEVAVED